MTVEINTSGLATGDAAGLALLSWPYAWIGVVQAADGATLQMVTGGGGPARQAVVSSRANAPIISLASPPQHLWLRVHCNFDTDEAVFSWSPDGKVFTMLGNPFRTTFQLTTFQGVHHAFSNFNTNGQPGGYADFGNYTVEEPRARGVEREIPLGQTITLTSGADGSHLAADTQSNVLVNIAGDTNGAISEEVKFKVVDLGLGRVALKTANGRFVSADQQGAVLKDLAGKAPGDAETFQWINLMRGDTTFMSACKTPVSGHQTG